MDLQGTFTGDGTYYVSYEALHKFGWSCKLFSSAALVATYRKCTQASAICMWSDIVLVNSNPAAKSTAGLLDLNTAYVFRHAVSSVERRF